MGHDCVIHLHDHVIDAEVICSSQAGQHVLIPRIKLTPSDASLPFVLVMPISSMFGILHDHKQDTRTNILQSRHLFAAICIQPWQELYVAFSHARSFKELFDKIEGMLTYNIVYHEVLQSHF